MEHTATPVPLVSIGMPAYNAEQTIGDSVECLLRQTLTDFELIISDNASTDGTWAIVEECARRDPRIVPVRQAQNIGATRCEKIVSVVVTRNSPEGRTSCPAMRRSNSMMDSAIRIASATISSPADVSR